LLLPLPASPNHLHHCLSAPGPLLPAQPSCPQKLIFVGLLCPFAPESGTGLDHIGSIGSAIAEASGSAFGSLGPCLPPGRIFFSVLCPSSPGISGLGSWLQAQRLAQSSRRSPYLPAIVSRCRVLSNVPGSALCSLDPPLPWVLAVKNNLLVDCCIILCSSRLFGNGPRLQAQPSAPSGRK